MSFGGPRLRCQFLSPPFAAKRFYHASTKANPKLTFHPDHSLGANQTPFAEDCCLTSKSVVATNETRWHADGAQRVRDPAGLTDYSET